jgi:hypothetical protein
MLLTFDSPVEHVLVLLFLQVVPKHSNVLHFQLPENLNQRIVADPFLVSVAFTNVFVFLQDVIEHLLVGHSYLIRSINDALCFCLTLVIIASRKAFIESPSS